MQSLRTLLSQPNTSSHLQCLAADKQHADEARAFVTECVNVCMQLALAVQPILSLDTPEGFSLDEGTAYCYPRTLFSVELCLCCSAVVCCLIVILLCCHCQTWKYKHFKHPLSEFLCLLSSADTSFCSTLCTGADEAFSPGDTEFAAKDFQSQLVMVCSWRCLKEVALLLAQLLVVCSVPGTAKRQLDIILLSPRQVRWSSCFRRGILLCTQVSRCVSVGHR